MSGGAATESGIGFQRRFALLRTIELASTETLHVWSESPKSVPTAAEPWDIRIAGQDKDGTSIVELWQAKSGGLSVNDSIDKLVSMTAEEPGATHYGLLLGARTGSVVNAGHIMTTAARASRFEPAHAREILRPFRSPKILLELSTKLCGHGIANFEELDWAHDPKGVIDFLSRFSRFSIRVIDPDSIDAVLFQHASNRYPASSVEGLHSAIAGSLSILEKFGTTGIPSQNVLKPLINVRVSRDDVRAILDKPNKDIEHPINPGMPSLKDLFVSARAKISQKGAVESTNISNVRKWLFDRLSKRGIDFLLLLGDFGHGKTSLLRRVAADLVDNYASHGALPVFVPLRLCFEKGNLRDAVANALRGVAVVDDELWVSRRWIVLCDGFDELSLCNPSQEDWVAERLAELMRASQELGVTVVVSSRPVLFLDPAQHHSLIKQYERLHLLEFDDTEVCAWLEKWSERRSPIRHIDLTSRHLGEIVRTPVILYLVAQMFHDRFADLDRPLSLAEVYKQFFDWVEATGGAVEVVERLKHKPPTRQTLREVAWFLSCHPTAVAGTMHYRVLAAELEGRAEKAALDCDERLFVSHAFRQANAELGYIEFIHQSLREALLAEDIVNNLRQTQKDDTAYLIDLIRLFRTAIVPTNATIRFVRDALTDLPLDQCRQIAKKLYGMPSTGSIVDVILRSDGHTLRPRWFSWSDDHVQELHDQLSVMRVAYVLSAFLTILKARPRTDQSLSFKNLGWEYGVVRRFLESDPTASTSLVLLRSELSGANIDNANFTNCRLDGVNFERVSMKGTNFDSCTFEGTAFGWAKGDEATTFNSCLFIGTFWANAELQGVTFNECTFSCEPPYGGVAARFKGCRLRGFQWLRLKNTASFRRCIFEVTQSEFDQTIEAVNSGESLSDCTVVLDYRE